jgi:hypothetical protein
MAPLDEEKGRWGSFSQQLKVWGNRNRFVASSRVAGGIFGKLSVAAE